LICSISLWAAFLCLGAIGAVGALVVYPQAVGAYHWRRARAAVEQFDLKTARAEMERCLQIRPKNGEAHFLMARTCRRAGDFDAAREHLAEAERLGWVKEIIDLEFQLMTAQMGLPARAEPALTKLLQRGHSEETIILEALARGYLQINLAREAHRWTRIWVERHPDDWLAHYWQGQALTQGGQNELAVEAFEKALAGNPNHPGTHALLADALYRVARFPEAATHFQAALAATPDDDVALLGLANCQRALGRSAEARTTTERLLQDHPDQAGGWRLLGQVALDEDDPRTALERLRQAEALDPYDRLTAKALGTALRRLRRDEEAEQYEARLKRLDDDYRRMGELRKQILTEPKNLGARFEIGVVCLRLGRAAEAERWLVGVLEQDPHHAGARQALAECLRRLRRN
jgi:tetratricopeptide (TPR) repeat protein